MKTPMLRFKADDGSEFPAWEEKTLGEITGLFVGKSFTSELNKNGCYVVMDMGSVSPDGSIIDAKLTDLDRDMLRRGDLIMPKDDIGGGLIIGKTAYIPCDDKYVCGDHVYRLRFDSEIDGLFMHYEINSSGPQRRLGRKVTGSAQLGLNSKSVSSETVSVPFLPEQRKIADFLSAVDDVIAAQQAEVDAWEQRKKGVMQKLFSQEVRFKADDGSEFPAWEEKTLGEEGRFYGGLSGKDKKDFDCGTARFLTYMNVYKNTFASRDAMGYVEVGDAEKQNKVRYGDILFTQSSETVDEVGLSSVYLYDDEPYLNSFCMGYRFNNLANVCPEFIGYCMRSNGIRKSIMLMGQGISRINLGKKRLATVKYKIPSLPEQRKIADCLASMDEVIQKSKDELAKWQELKKGLLQQMFV